MKLFSKRDPAASFPIDIGAPLKATSAVYIKEGNEFTLTITITKVTDILLNQLDGSDAAIAALITKAKSSASGSKPSLELTRTRRLSSHWTATGASGTTVAELSCPILSLGRWTIKFPAESTHSSHDILMRPAGTTARADEFVKDSVLYFWDVLDGRKLCKLYRAIEGKRTEIARDAEQVGVIQGVNKTKMRRSPTASHLREYYPSTSYILALTATHDNPKIMVAGILVMGEKRADGAGHGRLKEKSLNQ
ncbi:hypothetical protein N7474_010088 [Penicillium riverlandense]|uniref:uncharacterized protein n=1 Tax=Penicillium riverlandense TaxID=1903569 RepID=UPI002547B84E|nr:uncharacterized protein N7474_010088 [Penicillium riverlandense]KAJ5808819.1 hypothetical protein N7474_010088 [Penicillium riverlandense]